MSIGSAENEPAQTAPVQPRLIPHGVLLPFVLVTALFFLWGVPNNLNDVLIRQFRKSFALSPFQAGLVQSAFYMGYFLLATPAALLMRRFGYKSGFVTGLLLFSTGAFLFWPAAIIGRYPYFLAALFVIASGLSFLETASNPFVAQIGDPESAARRLNFAQAFNPLGSIAGALVGTVFIFSGIELSGSQVTAMQAAHTYTAYLRTETMRVVAPYMVLGVVTIGGLCSSPLRAFLWLRVKARRLVKATENFVISSDIPRFCSPSLRSLCMWERRWAHGVISSRTSRTQHINMKRSRATCSRELWERLAWAGSDPRPLCAMCVPID